jgi:hypothetical protein
LGGLHRADRVSEYRALDPRAVHDVRHGDVVPFPEACICRRN